MKRLLKYSNAILKEEKSLFSEHAILVSAAETLLREQSFL